MSGVPAQLWINLFADATGAIRRHAAHPGQQAAHAEVDAWHRGLAWRGTRTSPPYGRFAAAMAGDVSACSISARTWPTGGPDKRPRAATPPTTAAE